MSTKAKTNMPAEGMSGEEKKSSKGDIKKGKPALDVKAPRRKKIKRMVHDARVVILARSNNTIISFTDKKGNKLVQASAGSCGFRGSRKSTPYAAQVAAENAATAAREFGVTTVEVNVKGPGPGREGGLRALANSGLNIVLISDTTPIPHNGVKERKRRRV